jgi:tetratricopeptide (TPR) repeat protein
MEDKNKVIDFLNNKKYDLAFELLEKMSNAGDNWGEYNLGIYYYIGINNKQDYKLAVELFEKASSNIQNAKLALAFCYMNGQGVKKSYKKGLTILSEIKDLNAYNAIGVCLANGMGVEKDYENAIEYFNEAGKLNKDFISLGWNFDGNNFSICSIENIVEWKICNKVDDNELKDGAVCTMAEEISKLSIKEDDDSEQDKNDFYNVVCTEIELNHINWDSYNDLMDILNNSLEE